MDRLARPLLLVAAAWSLAIYLPSVGAGLVKDDFVWIDGSRVETVGQVVSLLSRSNGFYRPATAASFTVDYALFGLNPLPYGLTNLLLVALVAVAVWRLLRSLGLPAGAAVIGAAAWSLNPHGINMSILWISGRTALLLTLFAVLAATSWMKGHALRAAGWTLLALFSKEEAVVLPFVLLAWSFVESRFADSRARDPRAKIIARSVPLLLVLALYAILRSQSGAFTPASAPPFYRFSSDWHLIAFNAFSYLDRGATFPMAIALLSALVVRRRPEMDAHTRKLMALGAVWFAGACVVTVWLPVRSSLYACWPSVGAILVLAAWLTALVRAMPAVRVVPTILVVCLLGLASLPMYWARNQRWMEPARLSTAVLAQLPGIVAGQPAGTVIVFRDRTGRGASIAGTFGTLLPQAVALATGRRDINVWVDPPPGDWRLAGWREPQRADRTATFVLDRGVLRPSS